MASKLSHVIREGAIDAALECYDIANLASQRYLLDGPWAKKERRNVEDRSRNLLATIMDRSYLGEDATVKQREEIYTAFWTDYHDLCDAWNNFQRWFAESPRDGVWVELPEDAPPRNFLEKWVPVPVFEEEHTCTDCNKRYLFKEGLADWLCAECFKHRLPHNSRCDWTREKCSCHHVLRYVAAHKDNKQATVTVRP